LSIPKVLVFGYGNPGRGDDALGPELIAAIEKKSLPDVECQTDMQLQVEHVTDLERREAILFVDADASCEPPFQLSEIKAEKDDSYTSHAISPQALLHAYRKVFSADAPPSFLLHIRGYDFELGDALSGSAATNLSTAVNKAQEFCKDSVKGLGY